jgi:(p)ppGpp synthase/HD superfamily hydrolase
MHKLLEEAIKLAVEAHTGDVDKQGVPYILHPLRVMLAGSTVEEMAVGVGSVVLPVILAAVIPGLSAS